MEVKWHNLVDGNCGEVEYSDHPNNCFKNSFWGFRLNRPLQIVFFNKNVKFECILDATCFMGVNALLLDSIHVAGADILYVLGYDLKVDPTSNAEILNLFDRDHREIIYEGWNDQLGEVELMTNWKRP